MKLFNNYNKIVLTVEYDGRNYFGFQWQADQPTIQDELEKAIFRLTGEKNRILAASRTDTGVHARGQVISFRTHSKLSPQVVVRALNYYLPDDIAIQGACIAPDNFDVRRDALSREYDYRILNNTNRSPLMEGFIHVVIGKLNVENMNKACQFLKGEHDFTSFASSLGGRKDTIRYVYVAEVTQEDKMVTFRIVASSFLPHQVRNTVGLLIRVGLGKVDPEETGHIMEARISGLAGPAAPPYGLYLTKVNYPADLELKYENLCN